MKHLPCYWLVVLLLLCSGSAFAGIYMYVDERGVYHYTNVPDDARYRRIRLSTAGAGQQHREQHGDSLISEEKRVISDLILRFEHHIQKAARLNHLDPALVKAVIKTESDFNPRAVSSAGAQGLMQLMPETARDMEVHDPFDPRQNIFGGTRYLRELLENYNGNLTLTLAAYNAGPSRVVNGRLPEIKETRRYVTKVLHWYRNFQQGTVYATNIRVRDLRMVN